MTPRVDRQERVWSLIAGVALAAVGVWLSAVVRDSAVAVVFAIGGVGLILYAIALDRLESFGPTGMKFRELKDRLARRFEATASDSVAIIDEAVVGTVTHGGEGQAAAAIRAAKTPEELAEVLVKLIERPESSGEQMARVHKDDELRTRMSRYGPSSGSRGGSR